MRDFMGLPFFEDAAPIPEDPPVIDEGDTNAKG